MNCIDCSCELTETEVLRGTGRCEPCAVNQNDIDSVEKHPDDVVLMSGRLA